MLKERRDFPDFPGLFVRKNDFEHYIDLLEEEGFIKISRVSRELRWTSMKVYLVSFLYQLHDGNKLKSGLYGNNVQNLGKIAGNYFQVSLNKRTLSRGYYYQTRKDFSFIRKGNGLGPADG